MPVSVALQLTRLQQALWCSPGVADVRLAVGECCRPIGAVEFVLGFILASLLFSFVLNADMVGETKGLVKGLRTWWFALAFVCIGLETRFKELLGMGEGRPAVAFLIAQGVNVAWTLLIAYLLFGGVLFAVPDL